MILFVFEGGKTEPKVFDSISKLYLSEEEIRVVKCQYDLPTLYSKLNDNGYDLARSLPLAANGIEVPRNRRLDTFFSQIFLFFDYDFQNSQGLSKLNGIIANMLDFFDDETLNGKLYVNYPMVESLKYTKELPDKDYSSYFVSRQICVEHRFKGLSESFAYNGAKGFRFIDVEKTRMDEISRNWKFLKCQNVKKANFIVTDKYEFPDNKEQISQRAIFQSQLSKYVDNDDTVAILNAFPLFLYDYFENF